MWIKDNMTNPVTIVVGFFSFLSFLPLSSFLSVLPSFLFFLPFLSFLSSFFFQLYFKWGPDQPGP
jgi:hypothetical protein